SCPRTKLAHDPLLSAILVMSQNPLFCERVQGTEAIPKPLQATPKPYSRHILGIDSGAQSHPKATLKPHQSHPKATPKPPLTWIFQTPMGMPGVRRVGARGLPERCAL